MKPPLFVTSECGLCHGKIEFDENQVDSKNGTEIICPHCNCQTTIFPPSRSKTLYALPSGSSAGMEKKQSGSGWASLLKVIGALILIPTILVLGVQTIEMFKFQSGGASDAANGGAFLIWIVFVPGLIIGAAIYQAGNKMAYKLVCSNCGNKVESKDVKMCKSCQCRF